MVSDDQETACVVPTFGGEGFSRCANCALLIFIFIGLLGTLYFAWAWHRVSDRVLVTDPSWPRPWPYPDRWLSAVEQWLDARNPAPRNHIKLHGEFAHLRAMILAPLALSLQALVFSAVIFKRRGHRRIPDIRPSEPNGHSRSR